MINIDLKSFSKAIYRSSILLRQSRELLFKLERSLTSFIESLKVEFSKVQIEEKGLTTFPCSTEQSTLM